MTKIVIESPKFYVIQFEEKNIIHSSKDEAVNTLKEVISENKELKAENIEIVEVDTSDEKWLLKSVPWNEIAISLIRGKKNE